jgi:hypothetical protein
MARDDGMEGAVREDHYGRAQSGLAQARGPRGGAAKSKESGLCYPPEPRMCLARQAGPGPRI